jgi:hypothetical protein
MPAGDRWAQHKVDDGEFKFLCRGASGYIRVMMHDGETRCAECQWGVLDFVITGFVRISGGERGRGRRRGASEYQASRKRWKGSDVLVVGTR